MGVLQPKGRGTVQLRDVRGLLREGLGIHRFPESVSRILLKSAEASLALAESRGVWLRCRHFTFVYRGQRLVSIGLNSHKTHPRSLRYDYKSKRNSGAGWTVGTHSEMSAVLKMDSEDCRGLTLVNTRVNRKGRLDLSRPCEGCLDLIMSLGFRDVYHTSRDGLFVRMEF